MSFTIVKNKVAAILPPIIVVMGEPNSGKTTFGMSFPTPLVVNLENGFAHVAAQLHEKVDYTLVSANEVPTLSRLYDLFRTLAAQQEYKTLIIDSLNEIEKMAIAEVMKESGGKSIALIPYGKGPTLVENKMIEFMEFVTWLRNTGYLHVILITQIQLNKKIDPIAGEHQTAGMTLGTRARVVVSAACDYQFYIHVSKVDNAVKSPKTGEEVVSFGKPKLVASTGHRHLYSDPGAMGLSLKSRSIVPIPSPLLLQQGREYHQLYPYFFNQHTESEQNV